MAGSVPGAGLTRWALCPRRIPQPTIVLVLGDGSDRELSAVLDRTDHAASARFGGEWGTGHDGGHWLVGFRLFELGGGFERLLLTADIQRELLDAILDVPHLVAIVPQPVAGDADTNAVLASCLGGALTVEVRQRSAYVARLLVPRGAN
jgi:hypothetical protein